MTREEIISEANKYYSDNIRCYDAFLHGVEFAEEHLKNVWHDASEEPQGNNWHILCQNEMDGYCLESRVFMLNDPWKEFVEEEMIVKWAYINDLLPKNK